MRGEEVVSQDREKPSAKIGAFLEAFALAQRFQHRVLHEVFRTIDVLGQRDRETAQVGDAAHDSVDEFLIDRLLMCPDDL